MTDNDLQNTTQNLNTEQNETNQNIKCSRRVGSSCSNRSTRRYDKSWIQKGPGCVYDKRIISELIVAQIFRIG
jgi:hypothetical protein